MTATFVLHRYKDVSGVSGLGVVAHGAEFDDGSVALHWPGEHPATTVWDGMRDMEAIHGHEGTTIVEYAEHSRLLAAYALVMPFLLHSQFHNPLSVEPHPDHPDRLLLRFTNDADWRFWIALMDGSSFAATFSTTQDAAHQTWVSPDGNLWLVYSSPEAPVAYDAPIGPQPSKYVHHPIYDDRD